MGNIKIQENPGQSGSDQSGGQLKPFRAGTLGCVFVMVPFARPSDFALLPHTAIIQCGESVARHPAAKS